MFVSSAKPIAGPRMAVFLSTETYVLIDEGSAMRPPIGSVTLKKVAQPPEAEREAGLPVAEGHGLEPGAEVLGVERAAPDHHGDPGGVVNGSRRMSS